MDCIGGDKPVTYEAAEKRKAALYDTFFEDGIAWSCYRFGNEAWLEKKPLQGHAKCRLPSGDADGYWVDGKLHGQGTLRIEFRDKGMKTADVYCGQFEHGERHGIGELRFSNGCRYVGEFLHDKMHGRGQLFDWDGNVLFTGMFRNNEMPQDIWWQELEKRKPPPGEGKAGGKSGKKKKGAKGKKGKKGKKK